MTVKTWPGLAGRRPDRSSARSAAPPLISCRKRRSICSSCAPSPRSAMAWSFHTFSKKVFGVGMRSSRRIGVVLAQLLEAVLPEPADMPAHQNLRAFSIARFDRLENVQVVLEAVRLAWAQPRPLPAPELEELIEALVEEATEIAVP